MIDTQFDFAIGIPPYNGGTRQLCHECCVDNESDGSSKRYLNKSQLTAADKNREICMLPSILDKNAA